MPLSLKLDTDNDVNLAVWQITEETEYFFKKLLIHEQEESILNKLSSRKLSEWLGSRYLLHIMSGRSNREEFIKDIHGKPHLNNSDYHISISHSNDLVAVVASKHLVGIDIQHYVNKIYRIKHKFVNEEEISNISQDNELKALHIIWGAKESLYKAYGKRSLDFKKNIHIQQLEISQNHGECLGRVIKNEYHKEFIIKYFLFEKFTIVYAKELI
ncbi:MAG: 4'-phosphopantetheinyl transferase superfamily protein [Saprospiraceae bacterium]|nr:4'-phosphopantetheinyl transferase superfamily protein [Saprospiraceae bacterium]